jgi:hypothetical protein
LALSFNWRLKAAAYWRKYRVVSHSSPDTILNSQMVDFTNIDARNSGKEFLYAKVKGETFAFINIKGADG